MKDADREDQEDASSHDADYVRTEMLERIAHELRGPAGVTLRAIEEMELALGPDALKVANFLAMVRRAARRVLRTAERLSRTAQLVSRDVTFSRTPVDVKAVIQTAVRDAELIETRNGISVVLTLPPEPCPAAIDTTWVSAAVAELVVNAIAHARKIVAVDAKCDASGVVISVTDDGAGFDGAIPERFTPPRGRRGLGLSLAIVQDVAAAHGGELLVERRKAADPSDPRGATVRLRIPHAGPASVVSSQ